MLKIELTPSITAKEYFQLDGVFSRDLVWTFQAYLGSLDNRLHNFKVGILVPLYSMFLSHVGDSNDQQR
jgi:hypothetical protein